MTYDKLTDKLREAEICVNEGNSDKAEYLAKEVLKELSFDGNIITGMQDALVLPADNQRQRLDFIRTHARTMHLLGTIEWRRGEYSPALEHCTAALAAFEAIDDQTEIARTKRSIGNVYVHLSDYPRALEFYNYALNIFEKAGITGELAGTICNIGIIYADMSDFPQALEYFNRALSFAEECGNLTFSANIITNIGGLFQEIADFPRAIEYFGKALDLYQQLNNRIGISVTLCNVGLLYNTLSDSVRALENFNKAIAIDKELGNEAGTARLYGNIGIVYFGNKDYLLALEYFSKALEMHTKLSNGRSMAINLNNIGNVYRALSDFPHALEYYDKAREITEQLGMKSSKAEWLQRVGDIYANTGFEGFDHERAKEYLLEAMEINLELGTLNKNAFVVQKLAEYFEAQGQWKQANEYNKRFYELEKKVHSEEAAKQSQLFDYRRKIEEAERDRHIKLARFQEQEKILHNILPAQIAERMVSGEKNIADSYDSVSVFFSDIVGFTNLSQKVTPEELLGLLNGIFTRFDQLARKHGLEKIKTIGDSYMAVCGLPTPQEHHAEKAAMFAFEVAAMMKNYRTNSGEKIEMRIGLHSGSVVAGIIGENKFAYDLWGDAVNTASRMESHSEAGKIHVSEEFRTALISTTLNELPIQFIPRGEMNIKGKGKMKTYFLEKAKQ